MVERDVAPNLEYSKPITGNNKWCAGMMNLTCRKTYARLMSAVMRIPALQQRSWANAGHFGQAETYLLFGEWDTLVLSRECCGI